jgi:hypothetical protein
VVREGEVRLRRAAVAAVAPAAAHAMAYGGAGAAVDEARDAACVAAPRGRGAQVGPPAPCVALAPRSGSRAAPVACAGATTGA